MTIYFDDSLPEFAALVAHIWGDAAPTDSYFLRDASGKLTLIVLEKTCPPEIFQSLINAAKSLRPYIEDDNFAVATPTDLFDPRLADSRDVRTIAVRHKAFTGNVKILDRRMVGGDWLRKLSTEKSAPARLAFSSIKGGVGRSTALCILANYLATNGRRVLTIDLDLEAPGLGNMLLAPDAVPEFGLLDYLVEINLQELDPEFYANVIGSSWLGQGLGRIDVIPALGTRSLQMPPNVLGKIARAYLAGGSDDDALTFTDRINDLLENVAEKDRYDAILIDARAGLHETTATAIIGLGAHVMLFGVDQPQTLSGYELLFSHLSTIPTPNSEGDWASRLTFINAKAEDAINSHNFEQQIEDLFNKYFNPLDDHAQQASSKAEAELDGLKDSFEVEWNNSDLSPLSLDAIVTDNHISIFSIQDSAHFRKFDPITKPLQLDQSIYEITYGEFLQSACNSLKVAFDE